jgi:poly(hydroxyalkanoate) depolymerase family esterase
MAGLKQTTAKLAQYRRQFEKLLASAASKSPPARSRPPGRLSEVSDFGSNPGNLRMFTYVPHDCPAGAPLVVVLHGCTQTAASYDLGAGWSTLADRYGFALLLPEQQGANNPNNCFNWFAPSDIKRGRGEAHSIRQMIERLVSKEQLDRDRVFVTGLSAGGAMAAVMLATYPEVFAGGAIIGGLPYGVAANVQEALDAMFHGKSLSSQAWGDIVRRASDHKGPWPKISIWHGDADSTVQPSNAAALVKQWTDVHGLPHDPDVVETVNGYPRRVWRSRAGDALVESYSITGMGHGAPIASGSASMNCGTAGPFILEAGISSSYRIASFWGIDGVTAPRASRRAEIKVDAAVEASEGSRELVPAGAGRALPPFPRHTPAAAAHARRRSGFDPHAVITKALRSAGLLK